MIKTMMGCIASFIMSIYLYLTGNEFVSLTGGWVTTAFSGDTSLWSSWQSPSLTHAATYLQADISETNSPIYSGAFGTDNAVSLTGVTKIRVKLSASLSAISSPASGRFQRLYLFATNDDPPINWLSSSNAIVLVHEHTTAYSETLTDVEYDLNVSLTGNYWVWVGLAWGYQSAPSWVRVSEVTRIY